MLKELNSIFVIVFSCLIFITSAHASWPQFNVLSPESIESTFFVHEGCKSNEVHIPADSKVAIHSRNIPDNETWYWYYQGNSECHKLPENLQYIGFHQTDHYPGGIIDTIYGTKQDPLFHFIFIIPRPYWYCGRLAGPNPPQTIACAQDRLYSLS